MKCLTFRILGNLAAIAALAALALFASVIALEGGDLTSRIETALQTVLGHRVTVGSISIKPALVPTLILGDVTIANILGGSRPDMARIDRLTIVFEMLPLLSGWLTVSNIAVSNADLVLECDREGRPNWQISTLAIEQDEIPHAASARPVGKKR